MSRYPTKTDRQPDTAEDQDAIDDAIARRQARETERQISDYEERKSYDTYL